MNILPLPERFDANEWFIIAGIVLGYAILIPFCRRFPLTILYLILLYGLTAAKFMDVTVGFTPFNLYDINDSKKYELMDFLLHFLYLPHAYFFVYLYDRWNIHGIYTFLYIAGFSLIGIGFEEIGHLSGAYHYKEWNLLFSFTVYLYMQSFLLLFFKILMNHYNKTKVT
jgi:hypothetical protein